MTATLFSALAAAQGAFLPIPKNREVFIKSDKGNYKFRYADLEVVIAATRPALSANGLCVIQRAIRSEDGMEYLETILAHASGEQITSRLPMIPFKGSDDPKRYGAGLSYARRYMYNAMLCLAADDDLDEAPSSPEPDEPSRPEQDEPGPKASTESRPIGAGEEAWLKKKMAAAKLGPEYLAEFKVSDPMTMAEFATVKAALLKA